MTRGTPLGQWLGDLPVERFCREHLGHTPYASAGTAIAYSEAFTWSELDAVLRATPPPDVLVIARGERVVRPAPTTLAETRVLLSQGIGLAMRRNERCHEGLAALAEAVAGELGGVGHVQLFVTPGGSHGFGWHYDDEDVFIVQTAGVKEYYFRANTVVPDVSASTPGTFGHHGDETSPLLSACLVPGDFLYLPSRWWHMAMCTEEALSISLGIMLRS